MATAITNLADMVRTPKYPWDEWEDGSIWEAHAEEDYTVSDKSFYQGVQNHAKLMRQRGIDVRAVTRNPSQGVVQFQFVYGSETEDGNSG